MTVFRISNRKPPLPAPKIISQFVSSVDQFRSISTNIKIRFTLFETINSSSCWYTLLGHSDWLKFRTQSSDLRCNDKLVYQLFTYCCTLTNTVFARLPLAFCVTSPYLATINWPIVLWTFQQKLSTTLKVSRTLVWVVKEVSDHIYWVITWLLYKAENEKNRNRSAGRLSKNAWFILHEVCFTMQYESDTERQSLRRQFS